MTKSVTCAHAVVKYCDCNVFIVLLTFINIVKVKWAANGQSVVTTVTITLLLTIGVVGLVHIGQGMVI